MKFRNSYLPLAMLLCATQCADGQAASYCDGMTSIGNPYPCCAGGNCTWWSWKEAADNWGIHLPGWGNANTWVKDATAAGFTVNRVAAPSTIGVNVTEFDKALNESTGHLVWVISVSGDGQTIYGTQMICGAKGMTAEQYPTSFFTNGGGGLHLSQDIRPNPERDEQHAAFYQAFSERSTHHDQWR